MSKGWNDSTPRFTEERKARVDRPSPMDTEPKFCWCGEQHDQRSEKNEYGGAGTHPWPALDDVGGDDDG